MKTSDIASIIIELEKVALEEWNKGNPSGYLKLSAPEVTYFDPFFEKRLDGYDELEKYYESIRGSVIVDSYEMINPMVEATENMAVLTYNLISYSKSDVYKWNCTEVYKKDENNQWKIVQTHWSFTEPIITTN